MIDETLLIPDLKDWKKENGDSFGIRDWISCEGNVKLGIGFSMIFWPEFIEHEGCVIISNRFSQDNFDNWKSAEYVKNYRQIESVLNHTHILDLFSWEKQEEMVVEQVKFLGEKMKEMYQAKLKFEFPNKEFEVVFNGKEDLEDLIDYEVSFSQPMNGNREIK